MSSLLIICAMLLGFSIPAYMTFAAVRDKHARETSIATGVAIPAHPPYVELKPSEATQQQSQFVRKPEATAENGLEPDSAQEPSQNLAPPVLPLTGKVILLDAGHGGTDTGAIRNGINEKDINLQVTLKLRDALVNSGATVILTRDVDTTLTLANRVAYIAANSPDLFLSIHTNAHTSAGIDGIEAYYFNDASQSLAQSIYQALVDGLGERGNWVRKRELAVVHHSLAPAALIEIGYLSNTFDRSQLVTDQYQQKIANSIYKGILDYFHNRSAAPNQTAQPDPGRQEDSGTVPEPSESSDKL